MIGEAALTSRFNGPLNEIFGGLFSCFRRDPHVNAVGAVQNDRPVLGGNVGGFFVQLVVFHGSVNGTADKAVPRFNDGVSRQTV